MTSDTTADATPARWTPERIRALRQRCGWSQEELAVRVGARAATVGRWERGGQRPLRVYCLRLAELDAASTGAEA
ncbi:MAG: helix-turn-helix transcriptional regulator [bacterium]|nr:helix-turn-helix transcriptional regulator [bacterium]